MVPPTSIIPERRLSPEQGLRRDGTLLHTEPWEIALLKLGRLDDTIQRLKREGLGAIAHKLQSSR